MNKRICSLCFFALLLFSSAAWAQIADQHLGVSGERPNRGLPFPSGKYAIGRQAFDWIDNARLDPFSSTSEKYRELMIYIWYPARPSSPTFWGEYLPFAGELDKNPSSQVVVRDMFGAIWQQIVTGSNRRVTCQMERFPRT